MEFPFQTVQDAVIRDPPRGGEAAGIGWRGRCGQHRFSVAHASFHSGLDPTGMEPMTWQGGVGVRPRPPRRLGSRSGPVSACGARRQSGALARGSSRNGSWRRRALVRRCTRGDGRRTDPMGAGRPRFWSRPTPGICGRTSLTSLNESGPSGRSKSVIRFGAQGHGAWRVAASSCRTQGPDGEVVQSRTAGPKRALSGTAATAPTARAGDTGPPNSAPLPGRCRRRPSGRWRCLQSGRSRGDSQGGVARVARPCPAGPDLPLP